MLNAINARLDARRVRHFMQVVESGSVRGAAEVLGMNPSAVSRAIGVLEQDCGTRLLKRRGRGVVPTDAGGLLAGCPRRQRSQKQQVLAQLDSIQEIERGHIDIVAGQGFVDRLRSHHSHSQPIQMLVLDAHPLARLGRSLKLADLQPYAGVALPMRNPLLSQGRVHVVSRHGRVLAPAAPTLLRQIVADFSLSTRPATDLSGTAPGEAQA